MAVQTHTTAPFNFLYNAQHLDYIMNATDYWPFVREYSIWNATVAALQFWTADLEPHILSNAIEQVYTTFFYTISMHPLHQQAEEVLFGCFVTMLNAAFESKLTLEDERYENGRRNFNIPIPLTSASRSYHVSSDENSSFHPTTPCTTATSQSHHKPNTAGFHLVAVMMKKVLQFTFHLITTPEHMGFAQQPLSKSIYTIFDDLEEEDNF